MSVEVDGVKFRVDVFTDHWDTVLERKIGSPRKMVVDGARVEVDGVRHRVSVYTSDWDVVLKKVEKVG